MGDVIDLHPPVEDLDEWVSGQIEQAKLDVPTQSGDGYDLETCQNLGNVAQEWAEKQNGLEIPFATLVVLNATDNFEQAAENLGAVMKAYEVIDNKPKPKKRWWKF